MRILIAPSGRPLLAGGKLLAIAVGGTLPDTPIPGDGSITVVESSALQDFHTWQRVGTSKNVPVSFTFTGEVTLVEARVVPVNNDGSLNTAAASAWVPIPTDTGSKTASGTYPTPQGGWYVLQARDSIKTGIAAVGTKRFGVGMVVLWIGQSNAENSPATPDKYPSGDRLAMEYTSAKAVRRVGTYADTYPANTLFSGGYGSNSTGFGSRGDGYVFFANLLVQGMGIPVCVVPRAVGGTSITRWTTSDLLGNAIAAVNEIGGDCELAMWYQGEQDAGDAMAGSNYTTRLGTLHTDLMTAFGRNTSNFKLGVVALAAISDGGYTDGTETQVPAIRAAQIAYANNTPGAFLAATGCDLYTSDSVHLYKSSYSITGRRQVRSALAQYGIGGSGAGPRITGAVRTGLTVDVSIVHTGGTALVDGAGGNGTALTGFRFFDGAAPLAYTASTIMSATTIRLTLASAPTGALTMDYAMTNAPYHADPLNSRVPAVAASVVYDNAYYHGSSATAPFALSTVGCPLQPLAAITVTGS